MSRVSKNDTCISVGSKPYLFQKKKKKLKKKENKNESIWYIVSMLMELIFDITIGVKIRVRLFFKISIDYYNDDMMVLTPKGPFGKDFVFFHSGTSSQTKQFQVLL